MIPDKLVQILKGILLFLQNAPEPLGFLFSGAFFHTGIQIFPQIIRQTDFRNPIKKFDDLMKGFFLFLRLHLSRQISGKMETDDFPIIPRKQLAQFLDNDRIGTERINLRLKILDCFSCRQPLQPFLFDFFLLQLQLSLIKNPLISPRSSSESRTP